MATVCSIYYNNNTNTFETEFGGYIDVYTIMPVKDILHYKTIGGTYYTPIDEYDVIYEIEFPIIDEDRSLTYDSESNMIFDEEGYEMFNVYSVISPSMLMIFKNKKENMLTYGINSGQVELIYQ